MIDTPGAFAAIWQWIIVDRALPGRGADGRLLPECSKADGLMFAIATPSSIFMGPEDHSKLVGAPSHQWALVARQGTQMTSQAYELVVEAEAACRRAVKESLTGTAIDGAKYTPLMAQLLEAIRLDFRLPPLAPLSPSPA